MNLALQDKVALVAGASQGLGFATAKQLAQEGAKVVIFSRSQDNIDQAVQQIQATIDKPENISGYALDLSDTTAIKSFVDAQAKKHSGIDILVTNTAGPKAGQFDDVDLQDVHAAYQKLVAPTFELIKSAHPYLEKSDSASILTITSLSVKQPVHGIFLSNMIRPAISALTKSLSQELGPLGIRSNSILPGWILTDRSRSLLASGNDRFNQKEIEAAIPLRRIGEPDEFGRAAAFLVSPAASYINGVMLAVDGGRIQGIN